MLYHKAVLEVTYIYIQIYTIKNVIGASICKDTFIAGH